MRRLTVLYDCSALAPSTRNWLDGAAKYVPIDVVPVRRSDGVHGFAGLPAETLEDRLTAVDDEGNVWRDGSAELVVLWALRRHRRFALRVGHPSRLRFRRGNLNWLAGGGAEPWPRGRAHGVGGAGG